jgi:hypothetical protein
MRRPKADTRAAVTGAEPGEGERKLRDRPAQARAVEAVRRALERAEGETTGDDYRRRLQRRILNDCRKLQSDARQRDDGVNKNAFYDLRDHGAHELPEAWQNDLGRTLPLAVAELTFVPVAEGLTATLRLHEEAEWVDVRSMLHAIWFWAVEIDPVVARAVELVLWDGTDEEGDKWVAYPPFIRAIETALDPHVVEERERRALARELATLAVSSLRFVDPQEKALVR